MATTPIAPPAPSAPPSMPAMPGGSEGSSSSASFTNNEDRMTDAFSRALSSGKTSASEPSQAAAEPTQTQSAPEPEPTVGDQPQADEPAQPQVEEDNPYADLDDPGDPAAIEAFLKTPRGREIYQGHKFVEALAKPTAQGGIGKIPTVQDVKEYFNSHIYHMNMWNDFTSGDPARVENFFVHWLRPDQNGQPKPALDLLEPTLAKLGDGVYQKIATPVLSRYEGQLINRWRETSDQAVKQALYQSAQTLHYDMTGEWLPEQAFQGGVAQAGVSQYNGHANGQNNLTSEWGRLQAAQQQLQAQQDAVRRDTETRWSNSLESAKASALSSHIDKALTPMVKIKIETPEIYASLKDRLIRQVQAGMQEDPVYLAKVDRARRAGNPEAIQGLVNEYIAAAIPVIRDRREPFLKGAGVVRRQQSDDRHAQLRSIAAQSAPANNGAPPQRSVVPNTQPKPGETKEAYRERRMLESMGVRV